MNRKSDPRRDYGPERRGGKGLDPHQYDSGDATILALLAETPAADYVDLVITWRADAYEVWSRRGMIRFKRFADESGALSFEVVEQIGENPIANQDPFIVSTIERGTRRRRPQRQSHRRSKSRVLRTPRAEPSLRVRANRPALRQSARSRPDRQPQGLRLRNPARAAWRARRRAMPRAVGVQRSRRPPRTVQAQRPPGRCSADDRAPDGTAENRRPRRIRLTRRGLPEAPGRQSARGNSRRRLRAPD